MAHSLRRSVLMAYLDDITFVADPSIAEAALCVIKDELAAQCGVLGWFDRVDSASNPVDKLSRGEMRGPWKLVRIRIPDELLRRITEFEDALPFSQGIEFQ